MEPLPETMLLKPSRLKWGLIGLGGLVFAGLGVWLVIRGEGYLAWGCALFGLLIALIGVAHIASNTIGLHLSREGFEVRGLLGRNWHERWLDCSAFVVGTISHNKMVMFERAQDQGKVATTVLQGLAGASAALPDTYGMKAHDLADLLNTWRARALATASDSNDDA